MTMEGMKDKVMKKDMVRQAMQDKDMMEEKVTQDMKIMAQQDRQVRNNFNSFREAIKIKSKNSDIV
jgi:hypothetical protein